MNRALIQPPLLTSEKSLKTVENRTVYSTTKSLWIKYFETYETSTSIPLQFNDFVVTSMLRVKKVMHLLMIRFYCIYQAKLLLFHQMAICKGGLRRNCTRWTERLTVGRRGCRGHFCGWLPNYDNNCATVGDGYPYFFHSLTKDVGNVTFKQQQS
jgi:hypothetical protein